jgi:hypothetical protein
LIEQISNMIPRLSKELVFIEGLLYFREIARLRFLACFRGNRQIIWQQKEVCGLLSTKDRKMFEIDEYFFNIPRCVNRYASLLA